jgi:hypothetical protein
MFTLIAVVFTFALAFVALAGGPGAWVIAACALPGIWLLWFLDSRRRRSEANDALSSRGVPLSRQTGQVSAGTGSSNSHLRSPPSLPANLPDPVAQAAASVQPAVLEKVSGSPAVEWTTVRRTRSAQGQILPGATPELAFSFDVPKQRTQASGALSPVATVPAQSAPEPVSIQNSRQAQRERSASHFRRHAGMPGFLYVAHNDEYRADLYKLGYTTVHPEKRIARLNQQVRLANDIGQFTLVHSIAVPTAYDSEQRIFEALQALRVAAKREFFVGPSSLLSG